MTKAPTSFPSCASPSGSPFPLQNHVAPPSTVLNTCAPFVPAKATLAFEGSIANEPMVAPPGPAVAHPLAAALALGAATRTIATTVPSRPHRRQRPAVVHGIDTSAS